MASRPAVKPNKRGARSRELVLDAAERLMAEHGYDRAALVRLAEESGIPQSSIYHYFGAKDGVLLAVMERGAQRFFDEIPLLDERIGRPVEHLRLVVEATTATLARHPQFLRLLIVMATRPPTGNERAARDVVERVRALALERLRGQAALAFDVDADDPVAHHVARFALAAFDGAFVALQANPDMRLADTLAHLPEALVAVREAAAP